MKCENKLNLVSYSVITNAIADGYFDGDGTYQPDIGLMNAMRLFYNCCVKESAFDELHPHNVSDILNMQDMVDDDTFITEFNKAIAAHERRFDFGNAYSDAMSMVDVRKSSIVAIINYARKALVGLSEDLGKVMTQENMDALKAIATAISDGNDLDDALVQSRIRKATGK